MKYAADFRRIARNALTDRWGTAVISGLIAGLLGAVAIGTPIVNFVTTENNTSIIIKLGGIQIYASELSAFLIGVGLYIFIGILLISVFRIIIGSIVEIGYSRFNLDLVDCKKQPQIGTLFTYFSHWKTAVAAGFLQALYVLLWSLLLIIPGIIAGYSYAMTSYILAEHPELTASEAIARSKQMMYGNRVRLFCLQFSFIGWDLLSAFTLGVGDLWLNPYKYTAIAAFYREVSGTERITLPDDFAPEN